LPPALMGYMPLFSMTSYFVAVVIVAKANQVLEKGGTARIAVFLCVAAAAIPVLLRSFELIPANGHPAIFWIVGISVFCYYGSLAVLTTTVYSAIGDVVDEHELATGERQEGIFYAVRTFFGKMSNGIGHLVAGIAIDVIGFPPGAVVGEVPPQVIFELGLFDGVIAGIPTLFAIYFYGRYKINKARHQEILSELSARRAAALAG
ncbi:MAG: MFS transporter, partial [Pseudomonadales bacterium]